VEHTRWFTVGVRLHDLPPSIPNHTIELAPDWHPVVAAVGESHDAGANLPQPAGSPPRALILSQQMVQSTPNRQTTTINHDRASINP
jgi:hypothetical protein